MQIESKKNCGGCPMLSTELRRTAQKKNPPSAPCWWGNTALSPHPGHEDPYHYRNKVISTFAPAPAEN